ncbi:reverse transcriptase [Elysia marginata]|uniref:Reverse transcriptase n=1 Tax=Elysia marginata TaxID=1093978 RepID=A0AAV4IK66_9GAST|nr:reverse transcriptase [Elysia marginata]
MAWEVERDKYPERKVLIDGCDDWIVSVHLPGWDKHPDLTKINTLRSEIVIHSSLTQQVTTVKLTIPCESRMEPAQGKSSGLH